MCTSEPLRVSESRKGKRSIVVLDPRASIHRLGYRLGTQDLTRSAVGRGECWAGCGRVCPVIRRLRLALVAGPVAGCGGFDVLHRRFGLAGDGRELEFWQSGVTVEGRRKVSDVAAGECHRGEQQIEGCSGRSARGVSEPCIGGSARHERLSGATRRGSGRLIAAVWLAKQEELPCGRVGCGVKKRGGVEMGL
jgi:hypothetical protein